MGASCSTRRFSCRKDTGVVVGAPQQLAGADDESTGEFNPFLLLNDDVILCILSYVSYVPFERDATGTMTLADMSETQRTSSANDDEIKRLLQDYNASATKLNKKLFKRKSNISPFRASHHYYQEAFHGSQTSNDGSNDESLSRLSSSRMFGSLTHVLPLVNKRFRLLCNESDVLWTEALERLIGLRSSQGRSDIGSSVHWEEGITSFIAATKDGDDGTPAKDRANGSNSHPPSSEVSRVCGLITEACDCVNTETELQGDSSVAKEVFRQVLVDHKPISLPVFSMYCPATIGQEINIRLFEPRYRLLIADIMTCRPDRERSGFPISEPRPRFLFACRSDNWQRRVAWIVEVRRCLIRRDGIADIVIVPTGWAIVTKLLQRPNSGGLLDGIVMRSPKRQKLPAFCMRTHLILGQSIRLRLYEERYKTMISEVMAGRPEEERTGAPVSEPRPQFVFVRNNRFREGVVACLVDIESCRIHNDRSAQVTVVPAAWVLVESMRKRPKSGQLYDASFILLPSPLIQG